MRLGRRGNAEAKIDVRHSFAVFSSGGIVNPVVASKSVGTRVEEGKLLPKWRTRTCWPDRGASSVRKCARDRRDAAERSTVCGKGASS